MGTSAHMKLYKSMAMSYRTLYDNSLVASTVRKIELCFCWWFHFVLAVSQFSFNVFHFGAQRTVTYN